uniref:Uncharacterized protein n=1 Tax=Rhizophora mucronata TaxID=61149 RepID=A0A2P2NXJ4_RHIMU
MEVTRGNSSCKLINIWLELKSQNIPFQVC